MAQLLIESPIIEAQKRGIDICYADLASDLKNVSLILKPEIDKILKEYEDDENIRNIISNSIPKEGSAHRGIFVYLLGKHINEKRARRIAASVELFYWATAGLDDIADKNNFRQGAQSTRTTFNDTIAMYTCNLLYGIVVKAISDELKEEPEKFQNINKYLANNFHVINRGQAVDCLMESKTIDNVSIKDYLELITQTTGVDVASSLAIGEIIGEDDKKSEEELYKFGINLGTLAQIRDDVLDYCDIVDDRGHFIIGKMPFRDIKSHKKRLPLLVTKDSSLKYLPYDLYEKIEQEYILPRKKEAYVFLQNSNIATDTKKSFNRILDAWSDINIFEKLMKK